MQCVAKRLEKTLALSLSRYIDVSKPLLLALSGGSDSMALLGLLLEASKQRTQPLSLFAVYIDHGWRAESREEALALQRYTQALGVPLFIHTLDVEPFNEELARKGRLTCFHELMQQTGSQAVCLAHHLDDQEETLLKRLFEGSGLTRLRGMQEFSVHDNGLCLWRPMLTHRKQDLAQFIEEKQMPHWKDHTNDDPRFLRVRMRQSLIPLLREHFGKEIGSALQHLHYEADGLQEYLTKRIQEMQVVMHQGSLGIYWQWEQLPDPYLLRHFLRLSMKEQGVSLSREEVERMQKALQDKKAHYQIRNKQSMLCVDRGRLFLLQAKCSWHVEWGDYGLPATDWQSGWSDRFCAHVPAGCYVMRMPHPEDTMLWRGKRRRLNEIWRIERVPECLRGRLPVIVKAANGEIGEVGIINRCVIDEVSYPQEVIAQFLVQPLSDCTEAQWTVQLKERIRLRLNDMKDPDDKKDTT